MIAEGNTISGHKEDTILARQQQRPIRRLPTVADLTIAETVLH